ncbi:MAG TPA: hypothetical protein PKV78_06310 [Methanoculleus thermophilus]|jgi:hypothetical protein|nr:hypothetical protein [Methanoculleus thermophilus]
MTANTSSNQVMGEMPSVDDPEVEYSGIAVAWDERVGETLLVPPGDMTTYRESSK